MTTNWFNLPDEPDQDDESQPWTLADIYNDLGTIRDVAKEMDVTTRRADMWIQRRERIKCPMPVRTLGGVHIYSIQEWKDWYANWTKNRKPNTKWTDNARSYGNFGLATRIKMAADEPAKD